MRTHLFPRSLGPLVVALTFAGGSPVLAAQPAERPETDTLKLILQELRELRRSVELTALVQLKAQVAAERMKLREPLVHTLTEQVGHAEQAQAAAVAELEHGQADMARLEEKLGQETVPEAQRELGAQRRALLDAIGFMSRQEEEARRQAQAIRASLATERSELERLSDELGRLERSLERHVTAGGAEDPPAPR